MQSTSVSNDREIDEILDEVDKDGNGEIDYEASALARILHGELAAGTCRCQQLSHYVCRSSAP